MLPEHDHSAQPMDVSELGAAVADLMGDLQRLFPQDGSSSISAFAIVACCHSGDAYKVHVRSNDLRGWVQKALLREGIDSIAEAERAGTRWATPGGEPITDPTEPPFDPDYGGPDV